VTFVISFHKICSWFFIRSVDLRSLYAW